MFSKILVPFDGSEQSERALDVAVRLAKSMQSGNTELTIIHVVEEFPNYHFIERPARSARTGQKTTVSEYLKEVNKFMVDEAVGVLDAKAQEIRKKDGLEVDTKVAAGSIVETILETASGQGMDLIVIGNVGRSGISKLRTLGSVSRGVSERAGCPVMIVH